MGVVVAHSNERQAMRTPRVGLRLRGWLRGCELGMHAEAAFDSSALPVVDGGLTGAGLSPRCASLAACADTTLSGG